MDEPTSPENSLKTAPTSLFPISSITTSPHWLHSSIFPTASIPNPADPEAAPSPSPLSLFPVSSVSATTVSAPQWLPNTSFTTDLSIINDAVSSRQINDADNEDNIEDKPEPKASYELLDSSESEWGDKKKSKGKKNKKKRKRDRGDRNNGNGYDGEPFAYGSRKSSVRAWANSDVRPSKDYYLDSRGDPDNLAFGSLYRMDVVRYKLSDGARSALSDLQVYSRLSNKGLLRRGELDVDALDSKLKMNGRYWSAKYVAVERHKGFKRIRIVAAKKHVQVMLGDFIPLSDEDGDGSLLLGSSMIEESWEDEVLRKTKEFNRITRENPHSVRAWLDFAEFQDKVASRQLQKAARLQTLEKKISILEKAVELNPEDEDLLICLLKAYQSRDSADVLIGRWEKVLMQHSGSYKLWRELLDVLHGDFSTFKVSELRKMYALAIQALYAASSKRHRQARPAVELSPADVDIDLELGIVDMFLSLCRFEWQAGYHELATALLQAEIEYSLFSPPLQLNEQSKKRLFEHFWNGSGARVGEDGALGWSTWLEKEEETRQKLLQATSLKEDEQGGWTGWFVPPSEVVENLSKSEDAVSNDAAIDNVGEEREDEDGNQEEDDAALLRMLGIDADGEAKGEVHDTRTWVRWSEEESSRDNDQWMPVRMNSGVSQSSEAIEEGEEQLSRVILFEDVNDYLFSLSSAEARLSLVVQFIDFFGGEMTHCMCTNSSSWKEKIRSLETLPEYIRWYVRNVSGADQLESGHSTLSMEFLLRNPDCSVRMKIMKFLRNASLLCLRAFPRNHNLEEAILIAEEQSVDGINTLKQTTMPSRALAKHLLKSDRQDVLFCGVYARREAAFGNFDHARKVFDMALSSLSGLSLENQFIAAPMLYLWYAEMELADGSCGEPESTLRAMHILSCLGSGTAYSLYKGRPSSTQLLRAHQGFKERINSIRSSRAWQVIDDSFVALICSAALFEELTAGWDSGVKVLSDALSLVLPERKRQSHQLEFLLNYQVRMLQRHHQEATLSKVMQSVSTGLEIYPFNPKLFCTLVHLNHLYSVPNKLRWIFDELSQKKPSVIVWLFSLSYELSRGGSEHRIHGLFERALANDVLRSSVLLWRCYVAYEIDRGNFSAARKVFFRAIHACPWSKMLWLDGFQKLNNILSAKELLDLQEVMREKELNLRTDIYEILLQDELDNF